jgi:hypothetical protein
VANKEVLEIVTINAKKEFAKYVDTRAIFSQTNEGFTE